MVIEVKTHRQDGLIGTNVYNHNFFVRWAAYGAGVFVVKFPSISPHARHVDPRRATNGGELTSTRELPAGQSVFTELNGVRQVNLRIFSRIRVETMKVGCCVRVRGDQPLWKVVFCPSGRCFCPKLHQYEDRAGREFH